MSAVCSFVCVYAYRVFLYTSPELSVQTVVQSSFTGSESTPHSAHFSPVDEQQTEHSAEDIQGFWGWFNTVSKAT